jgi:hypothetical protein
MLIEDVIIKVDLREVSYDITKIVQQLSSLTMKIFRLCKGEEILHCREHIYYFG